MADAGEDYALQQQRPRSILDAVRSTLGQAGNDLYGILTGPSWVEKATAQSVKDQAAFQQGGVPGLMADTTGGQELAGGFGGTIKKVPGLSLAGRPPLVAGYHATDVPIEYTKLKAFPDRDLGTHYSPNPDISAQYPNDWYNNPGPRTIPVVGDLRSAFRFPVDAVKWNDPNHIIPELENAMQANRNVPLSLLTDVESAAKQTGGLKKNLLPMWQEKGFDSLIYPHSGSNVYDSIMAFDPKQVLFKYSDEGKELIKERGLHSPISRLSDYGVGQEPWRMPKGIMHEYAAKEPGQDVLLEARRIAKDLEFKRTKKGLNDATEQYHSGTATLDDFKKAHDAHYGQGTYEATWGDRLPHYLDPEATKMYNLAKLKAADTKAEKSAKFGAAPASDVDIKTWGLRPGATNKDVNEAIAKWAENN